MASTIVVRFSFAGYRWGVDDHQILGLGTGQGSQSNPAIEGCQSAAVGRCQRNQVEVCEWPRRQNLLQNEVIWIEWRQRRRPEMMIGRRGGPSQPTADIRNGKSTGV